MVTMLWHARIEALA
jgi:hypothetical protein